MLLSDVSGRLVFKAVLEKFCITLRENDLMDQASMGLLNFLITDFRLLPRAR
jgi:hypothetical protein